METAQQDHALQAGAEVARPEAANAPVHYIPQRGWQYADHVAAWRYLDDREAEIMSAAQWARGDIAVSLISGRYGDTAADTARKFAEDVGTSVKTVLNCRTVAVRFPAGVRRDDLPFSVHEALSALADANDRKAAIAEASTEGWTVSRAREVAKDRKALAACKPAQQSSSKLTIPDVGKASTSNAPASTTAELQHQAPAEPIAEAPARDVAASTKPPTTPNHAMADLQRQVTMLTGERDDLAAKVAALNSVRDELRDAMDYAKSLDVSLKKAQQHSAQLSGQLAAARAEATSAIDKMARANATLRAFVVKFSKAPEVPEPARAAARAALIQAAPDQPEDD